MKNEITNSGDIEREGKGVINTYHTCPPPFWKAFSPLEPFFSERFPDIFPFTAVYCLGIRHEVLSDIPTCALSQLSLFLSPSLMSFSNHRNDISIVVWAINIWFSDEMISCFFRVHQKKGMEFIFFLSWKCSSKTLQLNMKGVCELHRDYFESRFWRSKYFWVEWGNYRHDCPLSKFKADMVWKEKSIVWFKVRVRNGTTDTYNGCQIQWWEYLSSYIGLYQHPWRSS